MNLAHFPYEEDWLEMERRRIPMYMSVSRRPEPAESVIRASRNAGRRRDSMPPYRRLFRAVGRCDSPDARGLSVWRCDELVVSASYQ